MSCKLLICCNDAAPVQTNFLNCITNMGGSLSNIQVTFSSGNPNDISNTYSLTYDAVLYYDNYAKSADTATILNQYYNNGKGVVLAQWADESDGNGPAISSLITQYTSEIPITATTFTQQASM